MFGIIVFLIVIGLVLYLLRGKLNPTIVDIIIVLIVLAIALWIMDAFGLIHLPAALRIPGGKH